MSTNLLYVILLFTTLHIIVVRCSVDEFMSCDRYFESRRKSRVLDLIPCDMKKQSYCQEKGPGYPEGAIWKFKEENRALMRRLYGDLESTSVYREMRSALSGPSSHMSRSAQGSNTDLTFGSAFSSMEYNIRVGSGLATVQSAREPVVATSPVGRVKIKRKIMKKKRKDDPTKEDSPTVQIVTSTTTSTSAIFATTSESPNPTTTGEPTRLQTTLQPTTVEIEQMTTNTISPIDSMTTFDESIGQTTAPSETPTPPSTKTDSVETTVNVDTTLSTEEELEEIVEEIVDELLPENAPLESKENVLINIEDIVKTNPIPESGASPDEVVEYEEVDEIEEPEQPDRTAWTNQQDEDDGLVIDYSGTPVNACPVKEEVFAPYWANNTRDQVLALLNLYPFEQYIHMETCKYEKEEMLCRRGCRCEQQYRLHRLLAFDPSNECRGIFSDWFRFPSYCICKCYNVPPQFLEKKRKPRVDQVSPLSIKPEMDKKPKKYRDSKLIEDSSKEEENLFNNIPAILPYEAKQALLREISRTDRKLEEEAAAAEEESGKIERGTGKSGKKQIPLKIVEEEEEEDENLDEHFFYGNHPIMEFKLSDGAKGSVDQVPRK